MRYPPDAPAPHRHAVHQRRRAQRAEEEVRALRAELRALKAEMAAERDALNAYLNGAQHEYDLLLAAQTQVAKAVRDMASRHKSCAACGGFSREALDTLLEPTLIRMRHALGLPEPKPLDVRAGYWPVRPGQTYFRGAILRPFRTPEQETDYRRPRFY